MQQQKKVGDPIPAPSPPGGKEQPPVEALPPKNEKPFAPPAADNSVRQFSDKIVSLVDQIAGLSLLEVADLNALLKKRLNLPDQPMMAMAAGMMASPAGDRQKAKVRCVSLRLCFSDSFDPSTLLGFFHNLQIHFSLSHT